MLQPPNVRFHRLIPGIPMPHRGDRSANGTLPTRASRYCDAVTSAAAFGWHVYAPMNFLLFWDGEEVFWTYGDVGSWLPLSAAQFPHYAAAFDETAPEEAKGCSPPFLTALPESGVVQIWTGLIARTSPGWSLLIRSPANLPPVGGASFYEGMLETDRWFGPLFVNVRLTRTHAPIQLGTEMPLAQLQPIPQGSATAGRRFWSAATPVGIDQPGDQGMDSKRVVGRLGWCECTDADPNPAPWPSGPKHGGR